MALLFETPFPRTKRNFWELLGPQNHSCRFSFCVKGCRGGARGRRRAAPRTWPAPGRGRVWRKSAGVLTAVCVSALR